MADQSRDYLSSVNTNDEHLPNATATLVLGILSIVICFICGIVALIISNKDMALYKANPGQYSATSYNNLKAGRICSIVGIALQVLGLILYIIFVFFIISMTRGLK